MVIEMISACAISIDAFADIEGKARHYACHEWPLCLPLVSLAGARRRHVFSAWPPAIAALAFFHMPARKPRQLPML